MASLGAPVKWRGAPFRWRGAPLLRLFLHQLQPQRAQSLSPRFRPPLLLDLGGRQTRCLWSLSDPRRAASSGVSTPEPESDSRERLSFDVVIVGAGPAGLSAAVRLKQIARQRGADISVCVLEKAAEIGGHILSGSVFQPSSLDLLVPEWRALLQQQPATGAAAARGGGGPPAEGRGPMAADGRCPPADLGPLPAELFAPVSEDRFEIFLSPTKALRLPSFLLPGSLQNEGNFVGSLGALCRWLADYADRLGVEVLPGFAAAELLMQQQQGGPLLPLRAAAAAAREAGALQQEGWRVSGVRTADCGVGAGGEITENFVAGADVLGKYTFIAEGVWGNLGESAISFFDLRKESLCPPKYALGFKEVWQLAAGSSEEGRVMHSVGYPLGLSVSGGGYLYEARKGLAFLGLVVGLDYRNPFLNFSLTDSLARSGVNHKANQPSHLKIRSGEAWRGAPEASYRDFGAPETRFCPAGVYEYLRCTDTGKMKLHINKENCIHCKSCAIKTPHDFIEWTPPEGGGGPNYSNM